MLWLLALLVTLVTCSPHPLDKRGLSCIGFRAAPAELPPLRIDVTDMVNANIYAGTPTLSQLPLTTWHQSGPGHTVAYRAWRTPAANNIYTINLEVQITAPLNMFINMVATSDRANGDPGLNRNSNGIADGSGTSNFPRRTFYSSLIGTIHNNVRVVFTGNWSKSYWLVGVVK
ncbi:hypothetical protein BDZ85DRAFT_37975 [Elsinoe ampelina]|uniref:Uncharacterized protein n=1 Tax=Elsinoe ampelina TaxID=302913 RepID=A0A6A6G2P6_9PEZI|nr:hypothetical protein BDZ85DRAFT_37975 [Elsinoe ampelina]